MLRGALAAAVTPLRDGGTAPDEDAVAPYAGFLARAGLTGVLALGSAGEGILLGTEERKRTLERWVEACAGRLAVAAHCGAQTTAATVELAAHAAEAGADAVAVIGPPYFKLDEREQLAHLAAAARACAPTPFYVYEFASTAGYPIAVDVLLRLREKAPSFRGLKVSNRPWEAFAPYLIEGLDMLVGPEALIHRAMEAGAVGAVSALAAAFPDEVAAVVAAPTAEGAEGLGELRAGIDRFPRQAALKHVLRRRGVPLATDVRPPLRQLTREEERDLDAWLAASGR